MTPLVDSPEVAAANLARKRGRRVTIHVEGPKLHQWLRKHLPSVGSPPHWVDDQFGCYSWMMSVCDGATADFVWLGDPGLDLPMSMLAGDAMGEFQRMPDHDLLMGTSYPCRTRVEVEYRDPERWW